MRRPASNINSKQIKILEFIIKKQKEELRCPTVREIGDYMGLSSPSTIQSHLDALAKFGYIEREKNKNRSIKVLRTDYPGASISEDGLDSSSSKPFDFMGSQLQNVPLVGTVQAGAPITAEQNIEEIMPLPIALTGNSDCFMLTVHGESMIEIGIFDGDKLIVRKQNTANNGDIVVARIDDESTVKRFFKEKDFIRLQPENEAFEPIITKNCVIEGLVIGLVRDNIS